MALCPTLSVSLLRALSLCLAPSITSHGHQHVENMHVPCTCTRPGSRATTLLPSPTPHGPTTYPTALLPTRGPNPYPRPYSLRPSSLPAALLPTRGAPPRRCCSTRWPYSRTYLPTYLPTVGAAVRGGPVLRRPPRLHPRALEAAVRPARLHALHVPLRGEQVTSK